MAFLLCCRFSIFTSPIFKSPPLPLSLHNQNPSTTKSNTLSYSYSSSSSSMDSPPQGYRRNVGICLINPSKKVYYLLSVHGFLYACVKLTSKFFFFGLWQIFSASRLDIPSAWQMPQVIFFFLFWFYIEVL